MLLDRARHAATVGSLADYTRPGLIVPHLQERDTPGVVNELTRILHREGRIPDVLAFYHAALNHEFLVNSAMDCGIAVPHARLNGVAQPSFAFGRAAQPLMWGPRPSRPVQFVFLLSVPATDAAGYLQLLSALARMGQRDELLERLRAAPSGGAIFEVFKEVRLRQG